MNTQDLTLAFGDLLTVAPTPRRKLLATDPSLRGVRIILGRPLASEPMCEVETTDIAHQLTHDLGL